MTHMPDALDAGASVMSCVSIIIPAYNAEGTLAQCIEACLRQTPPSFEVIVVDDGSTDGTARIAQGYPVHYVRQDRGGPAAARNRGARDANGEILAFTDSDCVPREDWIAQLVERLDEDVAAVGGTYDIANQDSMLAQMIHEEIVVRHTRFGELIDFIGSYNMAIRRGVFERVGGFDESFRAASGEDNDLSYRLLAAHETLRFAKNAVVAHYHPTKLWPYLRTQARHGFWRMKIYAKHPKRMAGDRYAGLTDLTAPVLIVFAVVLAVLAITKGPTYLHLGMLLGVLLALFAARIPIPLRMYQHTRDRRMLAYVALIIARDAARALGMIGGIYTFLIRKKATA